MLIKSVFQFLTNVLLTAITVLVFHASRVMTLKKELVSSHHSTTLNPLTLDVPPGIGITKSALLALNNGLSTLIKFVYPFLTNVLLMPITEPVSHASRVTILRKEPAFSLTSTTLSLLILDVPPGIGITKSALLALNNGLSMLIKFAFPSLTNALLTAITVLVFHASRVTILRKEPAFSLTSTMPSPLIQVAPPGIGITKNVFLAHSDGFSMLRMSAFPFLTNALLTTIRVTV
jgi:hypothetical protein